MIESCKILARALIVVICIVTTPFGHSSSTESKVETNQKSLIHILAKQKLPERDPLRTSSFETSKSRPNEEQASNRQKKGNALRNLAKYLHVQPNDLQVGQARLAHVLHRHGQQIIPAKGNMPELVCQRVPDQHGRMGMLCKPVPNSINGSNLDDTTKAAIAEQVAEDVAKQARMLDINKSPPTLHLAPSVYQWQSSSTFHYIPSKRHFYKVKYADNSALVIKTGEDLVHVGPYSVYSRFGLIECDIYIYIYTRIYIYIYVCPPSKTIRVRTRAPHHLIRVWITYAPHQPSAPHHSMCSHRDVRAPHHFIFSLRIT